MRRILIFLLFVLAVSWPSGHEVKAAPRAEIPRTPGELIALINAYRAENGLPAYTQNGTLMQLAQAQSDYQADTGTVTHAGPGGTRPIDRAYAAGYGGGQAVFVSEIIYGATSAGPQAAVSWWKTSQIHNDTMLASTYQEIGAGVATANGRNYYTGLTGYVAGGSPPQSAGNQPEGSSGAPAVVMVPVTIATPQPDGSVMHVIRTGQTLWTLAAVYEVPLADILALNNLPENAVIFPGDEILLKAADPPTPTSSPTQPPPTPTATRTATATPPSASAETGGQLAQNQGEAALAGSAKRDPAAENATTRLIVILALGGILTVLLASFLIQSKPEEPID